MPLTRLTQPLRQFIRAARSRGLMRSVWQAVTILGREGPSGLGRRLRALGPADRPAINTQGDHRKVLILSLPHTQFVADRMANILAEIGLDPIITDNPAEARTFAHVFAIAPQNFDPLPKGYIAFQMEQTVSDRWFTADYMARLGRARAILDYSLTNITALTGRLGVSLAKIYHVPIDTPVRSQAVTPRRGVLFYGDASAPRRQALLAEIAKHVPELTVETNLFGPAMHDRLNTCAVVLNLHFYDGALLETTRLAEALSHGCAIVSENATDQSEHTGWDGLIDYAPAGDAAALIAALRRLLDDPDSLAKRRAARAMPRRDRFRDGFLRALLGLGMISPERFDQLIPDWPMPLPQGEPRLCLSLPETPARRAAFVSQPDHGFHIWPGLKADPGWVGAALSFRQMARRLQSEGHETALIAEDDVLFPSDFNTRLAAVKHYLSGCEWDLFSGLIADFDPNTTITHAQYRDGMWFVHLDRAVSMVCNLYGPRMLGHLSQWDGTDTNAFTNTIDRHMQRAKGMKIVTTLPFLVTHRRDVASTLRDYDNTKYDPLIAASEAALQARLVKMGHDIG